MSRLSVFLPRRFILWVLNSGCSLLPAVVVGVLILIVILSSFWGLGGPWRLRARAPALPGRMLLTLLGGISGRPGARSRLSGSTMIALPGLGCSKAHPRLPSSTLTVACEHTRSCPGAHSGLPGSTLEVAWEHTRGCPGAHSQLPGSTFVVAREHTGSCPGAHSQLPGSTLEVAQEHKRSCP